MPGQTASTAIWSARTETLYSRWYATDTTPRPRTTFRGLALYGNSRVGDTLSRRHAVEPRPAHALDFPQMPRLRQSSRRPLLLCGLVAAVTLATGAGAEQGAGTSRIGADLAFLADDLLEGRAAYSRGYDIGARYVAAQMRSMGLKPGGGSGTWLQPVELLEARSVLREARVVVQQGDTVIELEPLRDFISHPSFLSAQVRVRAPMVFAGFGVSAPEFGHDDLRGIDVSGKVVFYLDGMPAAIPAPLRVHFAKQRARQLTERGAVGYVEILGDSPEGGGDWSRSVANAGGPTLRLLDEAGRPVDVHEASEAAVSLKRSVADRILALARARPDATLSDTLEGIPPPFELAGTIAIETATRWRRVSSSNVVGILEGTGQEASGSEYVVLMAHLDHIGRGVPVHGDSIFNGALDNAAGVAVLLEAARILTSVEPRPSRSVVFLATTAEEWGLLGSRHYALNPTVSKAGLVAAINIDMPTPLYSPAGYTVIGGEHSALGPTAREALTMEGLQVLPVRNPERGLFAYTDQYSFVQEGIPALYVHEGPLATDPEVDAASIFDDYLANTYHSRYDDLSLPIDLSVLEGLARINATICRLVASRPERPDWWPGDFYGRLFGNRQAEPSETTR